MKKTNCISDCTELSSDAPPHRPLSPSEVVGMDFDDLEPAFLT